MPNGYKIIDLKGIEIDSSDGATIPGTYAAIAATDKPTLVCNINNDGTAMRNQYVRFEDSSGDFVGILSNNQIMTVDDDDLITITTPE